MYVIQVIYHYRWSEVFLCPPKSIFNLAGLLGAFPSARPRRLSADVCVLELEVPEIFQWFDQPNKNIETMAAIHWNWPHRFISCRIWIHMVEHFCFSSTFLFSTLLRPVADVEDGRLCFCFAFGCIVCWGFNSLEVRRLKRLIRKSVGPLERLFSPGSWKKRRKFYAGEATDDFSAWHG